MAAVDFGVDSVNENATSHLRALLTRTNKALNLNRYNNGNLETLNSGKVSGPLLCGCLTVIVACIGTQFCPDFNGAVLVLEDIGGEEPYKLDRAITFLALHDVFDKIGGLVSGQFTGCNSSKVSQRNSNVESIIKPIVIEKKLPALTNLSYGHVPEKLTLPIGIMTTLDANNRTLTLTEDAVS